MYCCCCSSHQVILLFYCCCSCCRCFRCCLFICCCCWYFWCMCWCCWFRRSRWSKCCCYFICSEKFSIKSRIWHPISSAVFHFLVNCHFIFFLATWELDQIKILLQNKHTFHILTCTISSISLKIYRNCSLRKPFWFIVMIK